ncbi:MAG TPA: hypothetical protein VNA28_00175 [Solirubrobacteraceae bacterium]|nr:hypothetical protein [Solirubrobacteraceae bacterium]
MATAPRHHGRLALRATAMLCVVLWTGCGGDDSSASDEDQIRGAVERLLESDSVKDQCETAVSPLFVREVYTSLARCREVTKPDGDEVPPETAKISATRIDGDAATTGVTLTSVKGARATGRLALVKLGGEWKVNRVGVDFMRSLFRELPKQADSSEDRLILRCLAESARDLSRRDIRRLGNRLIGQRLDPDDFPPGAVSCIRRGTPPLPGQPSTTV